MVLAVAVVCFVEAGCCGLGVLAGAVITVLGVEAHRAGTDSALLITIGLAIGVVLLVVGVLYVLAGRGLLGGRRGWYLAALALFGASALVGIVAFVMMRNLWDLLWPLIDVIAIGLVAGAPRSRSFFLDRRSPPRVPAVGDLGGRGEP